MIKCKKCGADADYAFGTQTRRPKEGYCRRCANLKIQADKAVQDKTE